LGSHDSVFYLVAIVARHKKNSH